MDSVLSSSEEVQARDRGLITYTLEEIFNLRKMTECEKKIDGLLLYVQKKDVSGRDLGHHRGRKGRFSGTEQNNFKYVYNRPSSLKTDERDSNKNLERRLRKVLNDLSSRSYESVKSKLIELSGSAFESGSEDFSKPLLASLIFEYATRERNDQIDLYARLCVDLTNFFETKEQSTEKRFIMIVLGLCQRLFYYSISDKEQKPEEQEKKGERLLGENTPKKEKGSRENILFICSLFNLGAVGRKLIVELMKKYVFSIYGLKKGSKMKYVLPPKRYPLILDLCLMWKKVGFKLEKGAKEVRDHYQYEAESIEKSSSGSSSTTPVVNLQDEINGLRMKGEAVMRQYLSLLGFFNFLVQSESTKIPNYYKERCREILRLHECGWKVSKERSRVERQEEEEKLDEEETQWERDLKRVRQSQKTERYIPPRNRRSSQDQDDGEKVGRDNYNVVGNNNNNNRGYSTEPRGFAGFGTKRSFPKGRGRGRSGRNNNKWKR